ncbi:integral membrane protein [Streptomyces laurentii]|uniref:Integral membrane protein n=1 Tax=Streptomyces laurentii TaxID=39478 RepID=A0A161JHS6_STRLU|nr:integral membrane protein [Streptomyces laurentii]
MVLTETLVVVFVVCLVAAVAVFAKTRLFPVREDEEPREDVAEYVAMMVSVLYALVLGLCLVSVWDNCSAAQDTVQAEASALHQTYLLADAFPTAQKQAMRNAATTYAAHVVHVEWPLMVEREPLGSSGWNLLAQLRDASTIRGSTSTTGQQITSQEVTAQLSNVDDSRRSREAAAQQSLSPVLWAGLIIGGVLTLAFMFLFGIQRTTTHVVMVMGLSGFIAFTVLLIHQLDAPFGDLFGANPTPLTRYFPV